MEQKEYKTVGLASWVKAGKDFAQNIFFYLVQRPLLKNLRLSNPGLS